MPVAMQAGTSGGLMPSECGLPIGIDRPAIYFPDVDFVLSHTRLAVGRRGRRHGAQVPQRLPRHRRRTRRSTGTPAVHAFLRGPGQRKVLFGTNFPTVGHRHALGQVAELDLTDEVRDDLLEGNARRLLTRLGPAAGGTT